MGATPLRIPGYKDLSLVGVGGNAHVYRAQDRETGDVVAVKLLRGADATVLRRFERERRAMDTLESLDHVVPILESGVTTAGAPYLVMPLFEGGSLQERIDEEPVPWRTALDLARTVSRAVSQAHDRNILHLDVKPANVLLDSNGDPFLADFGIAEVVGATASMSANMMTPSYTPPERLNGDGPTEHTDVYGLGGLLFALLTGDAPFALEASMSHAAMLAAVLNNEVSTDRLAQYCPPPVVDLVTRTLSKAMGDRPQSAREFGDIITEILADESNEAFDPFIGFRVGSDSSPQLGQSLQDNHGRDIAEIRSEQATPVAPAGELLSLATPLPVEDQPDRRLRNWWIAAAIIFVSVGVLGAITATVWNGVDTFNPQASDSAALDQFSTGQIEAAAGAEGNVETQGEESDSSESDVDQSAVDTANENLPIGDDSGAEDLVAEGIENALGAEPSVSVAVAGETLQNDLRPAGPVVGTRPDTPAPTAASPSQPAGQQVDAEQGTVEAVGPVQGANDGDEGPELTTPVVLAPPTVDEGQPGEQEPEVDQPIIIAGPIITEVVATPPTTTTEDPGDAVDPVVAEPVEVEPVVIEVITPEEIDPPVVDEVAENEPVVEEPVLNEPLEFTERIEIGFIGDQSVRFRFTTGATTGYTATITSSAGASTTATGTAAAGVLENVTVSGLTPGTDYSIRVTLNGNPSVTSTAVAFRTSGAIANPVDQQVVLQNLRLESTEATRFQVNYESNICANGSFVIRDLAGAVVGSNSGQAAGCTNRHLAVPGFWTPALSPNTTYVITVTVEADGQGQGNGNTASQSLTVTTNS